MNYLQEGVLVIQWFPGHMTKALRMMEKEISIVDAVIYVLDSRAPFSCVNPKFQKLIGNKPIIYVLNKSDMADDNANKEWFNYFSKDATCVMLNSVASGSSGKLLTAIKNLQAKRNEKFEKKNIKLIFRVMVLGVPNSGKSTLINNLCGKAKTVTGNIAGVTRGKQWVSIGDGIEILDTPGTLWPAFDNDTVAHHLAYIGSIKENVLDIPELSLDFIRDIRAINKANLEKRYSITIEEEDKPIDVLEKVCEARKFVLKGNEIDYDRGAFALINDFKQNKLGKITLEKVDDIPKLSVVTRTTKIESDKKNKKRKR